MNDAPSPVREPGTVVGGKYRLGELLGLGGMGVVHRAEHISLGRPVAVKFLHHLLASDAAAVARFRNEASATARLTHPNVVSVLDYREDDDGTPFLVMEYVDGRSLRAIVADGAVDVGRTLKIGVQILAALRAAHSARVVHGDVKSANVLVEQRRDGERVKLVDFGLARVGRPVDEIVDADDTAFAGTPGYLAPEVILGGAPTPASDLYSVGIVLYELLTGQNPFGDGQSVDILRRSLGDVPIPPTVRFPERAVPRALEDVIARALDKDPRRRHRDALSFATALAAVRVPLRRPTPAQPISAPQGREEKTTSPMHRLANARKRPAPATVPPR